MFRNKKEAPSPPPSTSVFSEEYAKMDANAAERRRPPRLEPYFYEVKHEMKVFKLSEKDAERRVRKQLLEHALWQIADEPTRRLAASLLALL